MSGAPELEPDALLRALGRHAERTAPPFDRMWRTAQAQVDAPRPRPFPLQPGFAVAGIAALVAIVMTIFGGVWRDRETRVDIVQWRSPTAFLLDTPGIEWLRSVPRIADSAIGGTAPHLIERKETR
jgi:hypothetical protein